MRLIIACLFGFGICSCEGHTEKGFDLLYTSNEYEVENLPVYFERNLPKWLNGEKIHNSAGQFEMGQQNLTNIFDGYTKLSKWSFVGGSNKAYFTTKYLGTNYYNESRATRRVAPFLLFGKTIPKFDFIDRIKQFNNGMDNPNINIMKYNQDYVAIGDMWKLYTFDQKSLNTIQEIIPKTANPLDMFRSLTLSSSHPLPEYGTNNWLNFYTNMNLFGEIEVVFSRIKSAHEREFISKIRVDRMPYMHSLAATKNYGILFMAPMYADIRKLLRGYSPTESMIWDPNETTKIYLICLKTGKFKIYETKANFFMHHVNAYETDNGSSVVVDYVTFPNPKTFLDLTLDNLRNPSKRNNIPYDTANLRRYTINLKKAKVLSTKMKSHPKFIKKLDVPTINEKYRFKKYCFVYGIVCKADKKHFSDTRLVKKDVCNTGDLSWSKQNHYPSEPWFVPKPNGASEEDGILLSIVLDGDKGRTYLAIFDPKTLHMINRSYLPTYIPILIHGRYFDKE